jgi:hypothetical protein
MVSLSGVKEIYADSISLIEQDRIININDKFAIKSDDDYITKTEVYSIRSTLNSVDNNLQNQITSTNNNLNNNYYTISQINTIKLNLENADVLLNQFDDAITSKLNNDYYKRQILIVY